MVSKQNQKWLSKLWDSMADEAEKEGELVSNKDFEDTALSNRNIESDDIVYFYATAFEGDDPQNALDNITDFLTRTF